MYDYLIVGSGLFGAVFAYEAKKTGKTCLILEQRDHIGGNCYTQEWNGINVHKYGAHIFRTNKKEIWDYIQQFAEFNHFVNSPIANYHGRILNMPFNMNTFSRMWNISTPDEAKAIIAEQRKEITDTPKNLEEHAISLVGLFSRHASKLIAVTSRKNLLGHLADSLNSLTGTVSVGSISIDGNGCEEVEA